MPARRGICRQKVGEQDKTSEERNWENLNTLFNYPTDDSARKVIYLAIQTAAKKWSMPIRNWKAALNRFIPSRGTEVIEFEDRLTDYI
jgi:transposase-like protein